MWPLHDLQDLSEVDVEAEGDAWCSEYDRSGIGDRRRIAYR
jgi:hypothetical protein